MSEQAPRESVPRWRFSPWWWLAAVAVLLVVLPILAHFYSISEYFAPELVISRETTYITEPLTPEGLPDYAAYLNRRLSRGVTPENNAAVLLLEAAGRKIDGSPIDPEIFRLLGMELPPPEAHWREISYSILDLVEENLRHPMVDLWRELSSRPWRREEAPEIARLLDGNARQLELVRRASLRPRLFVPIVVSGDESLMGRDFPLVRISRAAIRDLQLRAMLHLGHGRVEEAWQDALAIKRLGRLLPQAPGILPTLLAAACETTAASVAEAMLRHTELDEATARTRLQQWREIPPLLDVAAAYEEHERFMLLDSVLRLSQSPEERKQWGEHSQLGLPLQGLDVNYALRCINQRIDQGVILYRERSWPDIQQQYRQWEAETEAALQSRGRWLLAWISRTARTDLIVRELRVFLFIGNPAAKGIELRSRQWHLLIETALALAVYQARHGHYPEKLKELVPELLPQVPPDLFAPGQTLIYRRKGDGYVLYSVGENGVDDAGRIKDALLVEADLGLEIAVSHSQRAGAPLPLAPPKRDSGREPIRGP